jgi:hypothetical protein
MLNEVQKCRTDHPQAWKDAHTGNPRTEDFIRLLAKRLHAIDERFGLNGKRGNPNDISDDAINCIGEGPGHDPITGSPVTVFDVIRAAGGPNPQPSWDRIDQPGPGAWVDPDAAPVPPTPPISTQPPSLDEALNELQFLDGFYAAPEGLQRPTGLSLNGKPDFEGIVTWYLGIYQRERIATKSRADARAAYVSAIRHTPEWRHKHPGETP